MIVDLTVPMSEELPAFPGYPGFEYEQIGGHDVGGGALTHYYSANTHQGTHIDAPHHFVPGGRTVDELTFDELIGPARVVDLREHRGEPIGADVLEEEAAEVEAGDRVVLLTGDVDAGFFDDDFFDRAADITLDGAEWLIDREVKLIVNDFLTEAVPGDPDRPVHHAILGADIPVVEYVCNADAVADHESVELTCLPMLIAGFEGAPTRVIAEV